MVCQRLTFRSNVKSSLLKLLCTLARLNPLQPLIIDFFGIDFPSHPCSQLTFINFCGQDNRTRVKARIYHEHALLPKLNPPPHTHLPLLPRHGKSALSQFMSPRASGGIFPLCFAKSFLHAITLLFLCY